MLKKFEPEIYVMILQKTLEKGQRRRLRVRSSALLCGCIVTAKSWDAPRRWREQRRTWKCYKMEGIKGKE